MKRTPRLVAVFGSADSKDGDPRYESARRVGTLLVAAGYGVVTGGYGGVMEAVSRGAADAAEKEVEAAKARLATAQARLRETEANATIQISLTPIGIP